VVFPVNKIGTRHEIESPINIYFFWKIFQGGEYLRNVTSPLPQKIFAAMRV
jgi:hypothetical protein